MEKNRSRIFVRALVVAAVVAALESCGGGGGGGLHTPVFLAGNTFFASIQGHRLLYSGQGGILGESDVRALFARRPDLSVAYDARGFPPAVSPLLAIKGGGTGVVVLVFAPDVSFEAFFTPGDNKVYVTTSAGIHIDLEGKGVVQGVVPNGAELRITFGTIEPAKTSFFVLGYSNVQSVLQLRATSDFSIDADGDGYASSDRGGGDCNDADPRVTPDAIEIAGDGSDQNCDGLDLPDVDHDGHPDRSFGGDDCDDVNPFINPAAVEILSNGIDENCDGVDKKDDDRDGFISLATGGDDCNDQNAGVHPGAQEIPSDGIDQDCNGVDDRDDDLDGHKTPATGGDDCDDTDPTVYPGAEEVYGDEIDQNCDGWAPRGRILAIGDSVTAGVGDSSGAGYPNILEDLLDANVDNEGVPGEVTGEMLDRIGSEIDGSDPDIVIILGGYNDIIFNESNSTILENIEDMVRIVEGRGRIAVVANLTPTTNSHSPMNPAINGLRDDIGRMAADRGAILADTWGAFDSAPSLDDLLVADGLHPNHDGYEVMADAFRRAILNPPTLPRE